MLLVCGTVSICGCGNDPTQTMGRTFTIEYDYQLNWNCFPWGLERTEDAFKEAGTALKIIHDDSSLTDELVGYFDRFTYHRDHRQWDVDTNGIYPGYLCGIEGFADQNGLLIDSIHGYTWMDVPHHCFSFVCGDPASILGWSYWDKTAIHELGHQRAHLSHLCIDDHNMNTDHNADNCVMGNGIYSICTGKNLTSHPGFCENCRDAIKAVSW